MEAVDLRASSCGRRSWSAIPGSPTAPVGVTRPGVTMLAVAALLGGFIGGDVSLARIAVPFLVGREGGVSEALSCLEPRPWTDVEDRRGGCGFG